jgi:hypothetical protein
MFLHVEPSHSFLQIKQRIGDYFKMEASSIMFYASDKVSSSLFSIMYNTNIIY